METPLLTDEEISETGTIGNVSIFQNARILVTGGSGMVGSMFLEKLVFGLHAAGSRAHSVRVLTRSRANPNLSRLLKQGEVELEVGELQTYEPQGTYDFVFHGASPASPTQYGSRSDVIGANYEFARKLVENRGKFGRVLYLSSGEVYGPNAPVPVSEEYDAPLHSDEGRGIYPAQKLATENFLLNELPDVIVARLFHSFGPGVRSTDGRSFADFLWSAARRIPIELRSDGQDIRTFLYTGDAADAFFALYAHADKGSIFNVGDDRPLTIREFAGTVAKRAGIPMVINASSKGDYTHSPNHVIVPSVDKLKSLNWLPLVPLNSAIDRTLAWVARSETS